jgi:hypothetical protein
LYGNWRAGVFVIEKPAMNSYPFGGVNVAPWHPLIEARSAAMTPDSDLATYVRCGSTRMRLVTNSDALRSATGGLRDSAFDELLRYSLRARALGFTEVEVSLRADNQIEALKTKAGRSAYCGFLTELARGLSGVDPAWLTINPLNESQQGGAAHDSLNKAMVGALRKGGMTRHRKWLEAPFFSSPDQFKNALYYGDGVSGFEAHWYPAMGISRDLMRAELLPLLGFSQRSGRRVRFGEWGATDLGEGNLGDLYNHLYRVATVVSESGLEGTAWMDKFFYLGLPGQRQPHTLVAEAASMAGLKLTPTA